MERERDRVPAFKQGRGTGNRKRSARRQGPFRAFPPGKGLDYVKFGVVVVLAAVYSYALFLQPILGMERSDGPVFGLPFIRTDSTFSNDRASEPAAEAASSPLIRLIGGLFNRRAAAADGQCGLPWGVQWPPNGSFDGVAALPVTTGSLYGAVTEQNLPWFAEPPSRLTDLRNQIGAGQLVAAFRTTLPNPIWDEAENVARGAAYLAGTVLRPGQTLSLFGVIGPFTKDRGYGDGPSYANNRVVPSLGGGVCKIATALYNAVVHSDLQVLERKPHSMLVPYVPPGRDAAIATGAKDVRIRNNKDTPILLWAGMQETTLFVAVYGQYEPPLVEWFHEETNRHTAQPVRRKNPDLPPGTEQRISEGYDGVTVRTWIVIKRPGQPDERRDMGVDTYRPLPGVIEYGI